MKDNEIIKALECHIKRHCWGDCPNATEERQLLNRPCSQMIAEDALDLINRQQAEIERLTNSGIRAKSVDDWVNFCNELRAKAVKEFAERLKEKAVDVGICDAQGNGYGGATVILIGDIDNLVKEMVGEG